MQKRRFIGVVGLAVAAIVAFPTSAGAFECYNAIRSAQGNQSAAESKTLMSLREILADPDVVGLCPEGVEFVIAGLDDAGFRAHGPVLLRMAARWCCSGRPTAAIRTE